MIFITTAVDERGDASRFQCHLLLERRLGLGPLLCLSWVGLGLAGLGEDGASDWSPGARAGL